MSDPCAAACWPDDIPALIPVYNHAATIAQVIAGCRAAGAPLIAVVDDGSSDGSGAAAEAAGVDIFLRIEPNRGKGQALTLGLRRLAQDGHRQVLTLDADMQHPPAEAARLAQAAQHQPTALWLGERDMAGAPLASRCGRWWTSFWTWICCGVWPGDNQTGLRVYPLPAMTRLPIVAGRYAYEVESLIRAVWAGLSVRRLPVAVRYPIDRISHFDKCRDNLRTAWAFTRLVCRRLTPWPHQRADGRQGLRALLGSGTSPRQAGLAAGLGAAMGVAPIPGLQMVAAAWLALALQLNPAICLVASNISFGPLLALWFALEVVIGHLLLYGTLQELSLARLRLDIQTEGVWSTLGELLGAWLLGAVVLMLVLGLIVGIATALFASMLRRRRWSADA